MSRSPARAERTIDTPSRPLAGRCTTARRMSTADTVNVAASTSSAACGPTAVTNAPPSANPPT
nr:hypothetical protein [Thermostaphylospora chromogena]